MPLPDNQKFVFRIEIVAHITAAGGRQVPCRNVFHYRRTSGVPALSKAALATIFSTTIGNPMAAALNARWVAETITVRNLNDATDQTYQVASALVGAIATDSYDSRSAIYMQLVTQFRGRMYNGSKHFSPLSEVDTTGDVLTGAGLARFQTLQAALAANMTDANLNVWIPVVFSSDDRLSQIVVNPTTVVTSDVSSVKLNKAVGQMRRRRAGSVY